MILKTDGYPWGHHGEKYNLSIISVHACVGPNMYTFFKMFQKTFLKINLPLMMQAVNAVNMTAKTEMQMMAIFQAWKPLPGIYTRQNILGLYTQSKTKYTEIYYLSLQEVPVSSHHPKETKSQTGVWIFGIHLHVDNI